MSYYGVVRIGERRSFRQHVEQVSHTSNLDDWKTSILSVDEDKIKEDEFAQEFGYYASLYFTSVCLL